MAVDRMFRKVLVNGVLVIIFCSSETFCAGYNIKINAGLITCEFHYLFILFNLIRC